MTARQWPGDRRAKVRWPRRAQCGCWVTSGYLVRRHGRWTCVPCALAAIASERMADGNHEDGHHPGQPVTTTFLVGLLGQNRTQCLRGNYGEKTVCYCEHTAVKSPLTCTLWLA